VKLTIGSAQYKQQPKAAAGTVHTPRNNDKAQRKTKIKRFSQRFLGEISFVKASLLSSQLVFLSNIDSLANQSNREIIGLCVIT